eukprot:TRINITY_DN2053_c0_g1_i3.p1 TRINITY_DN2053_c0_g1~~TRINITY_DN2053_c0_g1_i3.p1  ORF type:complete len:453 (+),score=63.83 TRINITY_DN2053_c0_g1_i3:61-1419(+)
MARTEVVTASASETQDAEKRPGARQRTSAPTPQKVDAIGKAEKKVSPKEEEHQEFGGPAGNACIIVGSHVFVFVVASTLYGSSVSTYLPTATSVTWFACYHLSQWVFAKFMPGVFVKGQTGLGYLCNAYSTFWTTLAICVALHCMNIFDLTTLVHQYPAFLTTAVLLGDIYSVVCHFIFATPAQRFSIYDFFMGTGLHPRILNVDVKMVAETRISWTLLFLITVGSYIETARTSGSWLNPTLFMVFAHGLYGNACAKGEHFIPYTWDITTEKFGWMLCWWNLAGVPLFYCHQSLYLAQHAKSGLILPLPSWLYYLVLTAILFVAYWIWDEANYHKCYFKMQRRGEVINRNLFPTFRHVQNPKFIECDRGVLLIDGWYAYARKVHYAADLMMALLWGLSCGFGSVSPYIYFGFFTAMITHRASRDEALCKKKYGETWDNYLSIVPYRFIPGIY